MTTTMKPDRCYTLLDASDKEKYREELVWRRENCWQPTESKEYSYNPSITLPEPEEDNRADLPEHLYKDQMTELLKYEKPLQDY